MRTCIDQKLRFMAFISVMHVKSCQSEMLPFKYAKIKDIYICKDHKIILSNKLNVVTVNPHIRGIEVEITDEELVCLFDDLHYHRVLHFKQLGNVIYLIEKDNRVKSTFFY